MEKEEKARQILEEIENNITEGRGIRKYTSIDLIRFAKMKANYPDIPNIVLIRMYNSLNPEKSAVEQLENLSKGLEMPGLMKMLTNE